MFQGKQTYPRTLLWKTFASSAAIAAPTWPTVRFLSTLLRKKKNKKERRKLNFLTICQLKIFLNYNALFQPFSFKLHLSCEFAGK